jgi:hypothetical protein
MRAPHVVALAVVIALAACGDSTSETDGGTSDGGGIDGGPPGASDAGPTDGAPSDAPSSAPDAQADGGPMVRTTTPLLYVGQSDGNFVVYAIDRASGDLTLRSSTRTGHFPAFAELAADGRRMVVVHEPSDEAAGLVITPGTGAITPANAVPARGDAPTHDAIDHAGRNAFTAN